MKIFRNGVGIYDLNIDHQTVVTNRMMVENTVVLQYSSTSPLENLKIGDYFTIGDERYELNELPEVRISDQGVYAYTALFVGYLHTLDNFLMDRGDANEKFFFFGNAKGHLDFILGKINVVSNGYSYTFDGVGVSIEPQNIDYGSMSVLSAMHKFCEVFGCEFDLQGKVFRIAKKLEQATNYIFQIGKGKGLYSIARGKLSNEKITTVMYAFGGKTNMKNDERLSLDEKKIEKNIDLYGIREEKVVFEDIYPRCNQSITSDAKRMSENSAYWSVEVATMDFDLEKCILEDPLIEFTTGNCMGVQFKIVKYNHNSKTLIFEEKSEEKNDGTTSALPNDVRKPEAGDTLHFLNILLPDSYIVAAKEELRKAAKEELERRSVPQAPYTVEIDSRFLVEKPHPRNSDLVKIVHEEIGLDAILRIVGVSYPMIEPDNLRLTISDNILVSGSQSLLQTIRKDIQTAVASGVRYHPLMGNFSTPLAASEVVSPLIKNKDFDGFGFEKSGFAIGTHPDFPDQTMAVVDHLNVRKRLNVYELIINQIKHMGGKMIYSAASMEVSKVEELENGERKVYFDSHEGQLKNLFTVHDLALCQRFDTNGKTPSKQYHWEVTAVGEEFIVLRPNQTYSGIAEVGDIVIQYGNTSDRERQHAYIIDVIGGARTSFVSGLDRIGATGTIVSELGFIDGRPKFVVGDSESYIRYDAAQRILEICGKVSFTGGSSGLSKLEEFLELEGKVNTLPYVGRNLLLNTRNYADLKHWEESRWELQAVDLQVSVSNNDWTGYEPAIQIFAKNISAGACSVVQYFDATPGKKYVLSGYIAGHRSTKQILVRETNGTVVAAADYDTHILGGVSLVDWGRIDIPFVATEERMYVSLTMLSIDDLDCYIWFKRLKLEQGDRPTEWSPAYEDTEEGIANAKQAGETAQSTANNAQGAINAMNDDSVFDVVEKQTIRTQWEKISGVASTSGHGQNGSYFKALTEVGKVSSLTAERSALNVSYNALSANLANNELYSNTNKSGFDRPAMALAFANYGNAEVTCYNAIQEYYTSIAQQTADTATIPQVVVETSTNQVLRGEGFIPSTLSAKRVLKVGDQREVLDKEQYMIYIPDKVPSGVWTFDGWSSINPWCPSSGINSIDFYANNGWQSSCLTLPKIVKSLKVSFRYKCSSSNITRLFIENNRFNHIPTVQDILPNPTNEWIVFSKIYNDWNSDKFDISVWGTDGSGVTYVLNTDSWVLEEYDTIEYSGRNFLLNTSFKGAVSDSTICPKWSFWGGVKVHDVHGHPLYNASNTVYLKGNNIHGKEGGFNSSTQLKPFVKGNKYTISFDLYHEVNQYIGFLGFNFNGEYVLFDYDYNKGGIQSFSFTAPDYLGNFNVNFHAVSNNDGGNLVRIGNIKLELGDKTTPWQPAPEDATLKLNGAVYAPNTSITIANDPKDNYTFEAEWNGSSNSKNVAVVSSQKAYEISQQAKQIAEDAKQEAKKDEYLRKVIQDGSTSFKGGLTLGNILAVTDNVSQNESRPITGALVGSMNNTGLPFIFSGAPSKKADGTTDYENKELAQRSRKSKFWAADDGTGRFSCFESVLDENTNPRATINAYSGEQVTDRIWIDPNNPADINTLQEEKRLGAFSSNVANHDFTTVYDLTKIDKGLRVETPYTLQVKGIKGNLSGSLTNERFSLYQTVTIVWTHHWSYDWDGNIDQNEVDGFQNSYSNQEYIEDMYNPNVPYTVQWSCEALYKGVSPSTQIEEMRLSLKSNDARCNFVIGDLVYDSMVYLYGGMENMPPTPYMPPYNPYNAGKSFQETLGTRYEYEYRPTHREFTWAFDAPTIQGVVTIPTASSMLHINSSFSLDIEYYSFTEASIGSLETVVLPGNDWPYFIQNIDATLIGKNGFLIRNYSGDGANPNNYMQIVRGSGMDRNVYLRMNNAIITGSTNRLSTFPNLALAAKLNPSTMQLYSISGYLSETPGIGASWQKNGAYWIHGLPTDNSYMAHACILNGNSDDNTVYSTSADMAGASLLILVRAFNGSLVQVNAFISIFIYKSF